MGPEHGAERLTPTGGFAEEIAETIFFRGFILALGGLDADLAAEGDGVNDGWLCGVIGNFVVGNLQCEREMRGSGVGFRVGRFDFEIKIRHAKLPSTRSVA